MAARGKGAGRRKELQAAAARITRKPSWQHAGLSRAERVIRFVQALPVTKGILAGSKVKLLPDQLEFIQEVYGNLKPDGTRRRALAIKSAPKGNGKTGLTSNLALAHLLGPEAEQRGEVLAAAVDGQQAHIIFKEMCAVLDAVPALGGRVNILRHRSEIVVESGPGIGSEFKILTADGRKAQGLAPSLWIFDELAQVKDRLLLDNLLEGMGKRKESLGIIISTQARDDDHPLSQLIDDAQRGGDPTVYCHLLCAPEGSDVFSDEVLKACNPAWGRFLNLKDLLTSRDRARRIRAFEPSFRNLRANQRVDAEADARIVNAAVWSLGNAPVDRAALRGRRCYGGLDLSGKHDLCALTLVFPDDQPDPAYQVLTFAWTPAGQLEARRPLEQERFRKWIEAGHLTSLPGDVIPYRELVPFLAAIKSEFQIEAIAFDSWHIDFLRSDLDDAGLSLPLVNFVQGYKSFGPALDYLAELALSGRLQHGGNPILTAAVAGAIVVTDAAENRKFEKGKSNRGVAVRIDAAVALGMALGLAHQNVSEKPRMRPEDWLALPAGVAWAR